MMSYLARWVWLPVARVLPARSSARTRGEESTSSSDGTRMPGSFLLPQTEDAVGRGGRWGIPGTSHISARFVQLRGGRVGEMIAARLTQPLVIGKKSNLWHFGRGTMHNVGNRLREEVDAGNERKPCWRLIVSFPRFHPGSSFPRSMVPSLQPFPLWILLITRDSWR